MIGRASPPRLVHIPSLALHVRQISTLVEGASSIAFDIHERKMRLSYLDIVWKAWPFLAWPGSLGSFRLASEWTRGPDTRVRGRQDCDQGAELKAGFIDETSPLLYMTLGGVFTVRRDRQTFRTIIHLT